MDLSNGVSHSFSPKMLAFTEHTENVGLIRDLTGASLNIVLHNFASPSFANMPLIAVIAIAFGLSFPLIVEQVRGKN